MSYKSKKFGWVYPMIKNGKKPMLEKLFLFLYLRKKTFILVLRLFPFYAINLHKEYIRVYFCIYQFNSHVTWICVRGKESNATSGTFGKLHFRALNDDVTQHGNSLINQQRPFILFPLYPKISSALVHERHLCKVEQNHPLFSLTPPRRKNKSFDW